MDTKVEHDRSETQFVEIAQSCAFNLLWTRFGMSVAEEPVVEEPAEEPEAGAEENEHQGEHEEEGEDEGTAEMESAVAERGAAVARQLQDLENAVSRVEEAGCCIVCYEKKVSPCRSVRMSMRHSLM